MEAAHLGNGVEAAHLEGGASKGAGRGGKGDLRRHMGCVRLWGERVKCSRIASQGAHLCARVLTNP